MVENKQMLELTTEFVSSYVSKSSTSAADLPKIITEVQNRPILEVAMQMTDIDEDELRELLNPGSLVKNDQ